MFDQQIPLSWATRQATQAVACGISLDRLFDRALITPVHGDDRDTISPLQLTLFQAVMVLETNDGTHSMVRHRLEPELGPLAFRILLGGGNLGDSLLALSKFFEIATRLIRYSLTIQGTQAVLSLQIDDRDGGIWQEDIQLVYLYLGLTYFLAQLFPVTCVTTRNREHVNLGAMHYAFNCPVRLGSCTSLSFPKELLVCRPRHPGTDEFAWVPLRDALQMMEPSGATGGDGVSNQTLRAAAMADEQLMAPSTMRRRLARDGLKFRQLREQALRDKALRLLNMRPFCIEAIAAELGYADARSFRRFIKRATGRTPSELRDDHQAAVPPAKLYKRFEEVILALPH